MRLGRLLVGWSCGLSLLAALVVLPGEAVAQNQGIQTAGVIVDAEGVLRTQVFLDPTGALIRERIAAARAGLDSDVAAKSAMRKVSLTRLEKVIAEKLADGRQPTAEMQFLAGLSRIQYVFVYPESGDVVIAGPAEGWFTDASGRTLGLSSGRPVLELQDLIVALRTFGPGRTDTPLVGCSIDPTQEGLARMQEFLRAVGSQATPDQTAFIVQGLRDNLGLQTVRIEGVPPETHFAQVMVEADYRMKLIGIGLERPPVKLASYVDRADPAQVSRNAMQRWYFMPDYKCVRVTEDKQGMELVGDGVKLVGEDEVVTGEGQRQQSRKGNRASAAFVHGFTQKYPEIARRVPVYAQLRNLIDMAVAASFIQQEDYYGKAGWQMEIFSDESKLPVETYQAPVQVETAVASVWKGNRLMTPVGGGVSVHPHQALDSENLLEDEGNAVEKTRQTVDVSGLKAGQWWWD